MSLSYIEDKVDEIKDALTSIRHNIGETREELGEAERQRAAAEKACETLRKERDGLRVLAVSAERARDETKREIVAALRRRGANPRGNAETISMWDERKHCNELADALEAGTL